MKSSSQKKAADLLKRLTPELRAVTIKELARRKRQNEKLGSSALFAAATENGADGIFNQALYAEAKPLFQAAVDSLDGADPDIRDVMRTVIVMVAKKFGMPATVNMKPYIVRFIEDHYEEQINASTTSGNFEQDRAHGAAEKLVSDYVIHGGPEGSGSRDSVDVLAPGKERNRPSANNVVHDFGADAGGEGRDYGISIESGELRLDRYDSEPL